MTITEVNFLQSLHNSSKRDYLARMNSEKPHCMRVAKEFGKDYWDGDRKYGYGGYSYDGRWKPLADLFVKHYRLKADCRILDIGCGKGHLLSDIKSNLKWIKAYACDISKHGLDSLPDNIKLSRSQYSCTELPYSDQYFDFIYSINVFHNLGYKDLKKAIREMVRVSKPKGRRYICVESYRNEEQLCNLQCWALTCQSFYSPDDWKGILTDNGYSGDVEFIYFT